MFKDVEIALVGKYTKLEDAYASVIKALNHASLALNHRLRQSFKTELGIFVPSIDKKTELRIMASS